MTWSLRLVQIGYPILLLPLALSSFGVADLSLWLLFSTISLFSVMLDCGFGPVFVRLNSYFVSGLQNVPANGSAQDWKPIPDIASIPNEQNILNLNRVTSLIYGILSFASAISVLCFGYLAVSPIIGTLADPNQAWVAFGLLVARVFPVIWTMKYSTALQGQDHVGPVRAIEACAYSIRIILSVFALLSGFGLVELMLIDLVTSVLVLICTAIAHRRLVLDKMDRSLTGTMDLGLLRDSWPAVWRTGLLQFGAYLVFYGNGLILAQLADPSLLAAFLLSQKVVSLCRQLSEVPVYANLPRIYKAYVQQDLELVKEYCARRISLSITLYMLAGLLFFLIGDELISLLTLEVNFLTTVPMVILFVIYFFEMHSGIHAQIYMSSNRIPFLIPVLVSGVVLVATNFFLIDFGSVVLLISVHFAIQSANNYWFPVLKSFRLLKWTLPEYLKQIFPLRFLF